MEPGSIADVMPAGPLRKPLVTLGVLLAIATACSRARTDGSIPDRDGAALVLPAPRAGASLLGKDLRRLLPARSIGVPVDLGDAPATLVRFWTDTCPFCARSLPAVEELRERFAERGLATLAIYHPKPPRPVTDEGIAAAATRLGYGGPVAIDENWQSLEAMWPSSEGRRATSVSLLCDSEGIVRYVHPGPEFHPSEDPDHRTCDADFRDLERAIDVLLPRR